MPQLDEFQTQLRQSHDANRSEFLKHISILSVAGLGFNLIETMPCSLTDDFSVFWYISSGGFLLTILAVIGIFNLTARVALVESYLLADDIKDNLRGLFEREWRIIIFLWGLARITLYLAFTSAVISAIYIVVYGRCF